MGRLSTRSPMAFFSQSFAALRGVRFSRNVPPLEAVVKNHAAQRGKTKPRIWMPCLTRSFRGPSWPFVANAFPE